MAQDLKHRLLECLEEIDALDKQLSTLRQCLTKLIYRLPKDETPFLKAPERKITHKPINIIESLSDSPSRFDRRNKRLRIDDFIDALEKSGMEVGEQEHRMAYTIGASDGCGVRVNGDAIEVAQYDSLLIGSNLEDAITNGNLMLFRKPGHKNWDTILSTFNSL